MWQLDYKESWVRKNWYFWTIVLEKTLESPLDCKEIKPVNPKGNQCWIFIERTDAEADVPVLWPLDVKSQLIRKDSDAGKDWRQEEKGTTEYEIVGCCRQLTGHEFEQAPGDGEVQGSLWCCSPWCYKESGTTEWTTTTTLQCNNLYISIARPCYPSKLCLNAICLRNIIEKNVNFYWEPTLQHYPGWQWSETVAKLNVKFYVIGKKSCFLLAL